MRLGESVQRRPTHKNVTAAKPWLDCRVPGLMTATLGASVHHRRIAWSPFTTPHRARIDISSINLFLWPELAYTPHFHQTHFHHLHHQFNCFNASRQAASIACRAARPLPAPCHLQLTRRRPSILSLAFRSSASRDLPAGSNATPNNCGVPVACLGVVLALEPHDAA